MIAKKQLQAQVVPIEPRRYFTWASLFQGFRNFSSIVLLIITINLFAHFNHPNLLIVIFSPLLIGASSNAFFTMSDTSISRQAHLEKRKKLDERRQQAATNTLKNSRTVFVGPAPAHLPTPLNVTIAMRRGRRATYIMASIATSIVLLNLAYCCGLLTHSSLEYPWTILSSVYTAFLLFLFYRFIVDLLLSTPHQQLRASEHGLLCQHGYQSSYIPWSDAKLLAIIGGRDTKSSPLLYELSGSKAVIRWGAAPSGNLDTSSSLASPVGSTYLGIAKPEQSEEHYEQQAQLLLSIIAEKTGLTLYDLRDLKKR